MKYQCPKCGVWTIVSKKDVEEYGVPLCNEPEHRKPCDMIPMIKAAQKADNQEIERNKNDYRH